MIELAQESRVLPANHYKKVYLFDKETLDLALRNALYFYIMGIRPLCIPSLEKGVKV